MPYLRNQDLPDAVRTHLPAHAQDLYRKAFNSAWRHYPLDVRREEIARRIAWSAVKRNYHKGPEGSWVPIDPFAQVPDCTFCS